MVKKELSSFDVYALVVECRKLTSAYVNNIFQCEDDISIKFITTAKEKIYIHMRGGEWFYISSNPLGHPPTQPTPFITILRKHLLRTRVVSIVQNEFDRVIVMNLEKGGKNFRLIFELFGYGNIILVESEKIIQCLHGEKWSKREVSTGALYKFPPVRINPSSLNEDEFIKSIRSSKSDVVRSLTVKTNIGGEYSEEVCLLSGVNKFVNVKELGEKEMSELYRNVMSLISQLDKPYQACIVYNTIPISITPFPLQIYTGKRMVLFPTISEAVEKYVEELRDSRVMDEKKSRIERQLVQQRAMLSELKSKIDEYNKAVETIYSHFNECEKIISEMEKDSITASVNGIDVELSKRGVNQSAGKYYEKMKKVREKLMGVEEAIMETEKKLMSLSPDKKVIHPQKKIEKTFWFERYRWFISSEGNIVIAGKDAETNEIIVKKHLKDNDRYAHADIHGAPSVVIKRGTKEIGEETLREACEFAIAFSKAWGTKHGAGDAYWVTPEQVSKHPDTGTFLAKGAFMIRGRRNYLRNITLRVAVGEFEFEGVRKVMCGPESAVLSKCRKYAILIPGDKKKNEVAKEVAGLFNITIENAQKILPPGDGEIKDVVGI